uniref:Uncharacterized protein n=1 Tax=Romanomermis culicivorax TaxID=13658 RepID=A0A915ISM9_ROMCU
MLGLDFRSPQRRATSSGSTSLNSPCVPSQAMLSALRLSDKNFLRLPFFQYIDFNEIGHMTNPADLNMS